VSSVAINLITGAGVAGAVVLAMILGYLVPKPSVDRLEKEIEEYKQALVLERQRADAAVMAAKSTNDILAALREEKHR
jgi:hypothetical protein